MFILEQGQVERLCQTYLGANASSVEKITGFQADVYLVQVGRLRAVLKCYRQPNQAQREADALGVLRRYVHGYALPEVIAVHQPGERGEALILTYIHGAPASHELESPIEIDRFADDFVDWLRTLHAISCEKGFQDETGAWHDTFAQAYLKDLANRVEWLQSPEASETVSAALRTSLIDLAAVFERIPPSNVTSSSMIHGDAHAANFLVDPDTHRLCGVIDPGMARFAHCELDLVHLDAVRPDLKLLNNYLKKSSFDAAVRLRLAYFGLFCDVRQIRQTGVCDEAILARKIAKVQQLLKSEPLLAAI
ncbi:phosphotransferase [Chitinibacter bivalviorum]|uniref:Phosphotransferase n=1 Tax=Chitinibacter bivalviorum TaxID=2739434 RepID=A0A7H9BIX2_9NEIS|nr:phosphotransferase [Chitinibacter bivalviorum]QLG88322.1 phosphotransferase [Chitinibacter bivalviorum]